MAIVQKKIKFKYPYHVSKVDDYGRSMLMKEIVEAVIEGLAQLAPEYY